MLKSELKYVCLDFETTGLDIEKDEAIQIGILSFDHNWKVIDTFSSYIKPEKPIAELKDIVRVITGLSLEDVASAPTFAEIASKVESFFDEKTVIIGHNIQFDIRFLQRFTKSTYYKALDTFPLAQSLMPFSTSYSLEVLEKSLPAKKETALPEILSSHHDALYDAYASYKLLYECHSRIEKVITDYPEVELYLSRSSGILADIMQIDVPSIRLTGAIPMLSKAQHNEKKLRSEEAMESKDFQDKSSYFIGNAPLKELFKKLPKENVIYAFSQRNKGIITKNLLHELGLTHIDMGFAYVFNKELLTLFFRKERFDEGETYFALKYFFHAASGHSSIDLNNYVDRKIYHALKEKNAQAKQKTVEIMTHDYLYEKLREQEIMPYTTIFFFDQDRWYDTHMKWEQKLFDLHALLQMTDSLIYKDQLVSPSKESLWLALHTKLVIFIGIWQTEVGDLMKDVSNNTVEVDRVIDNTYFYKTSLLIKQINDLMATLQKTAPQDDIALVSEKWMRFIEIISDRCAISTKLYGDEVHFLVKKLHTYLDYSEFQQLFDMHHTVFLSGQKKDWPTIVGGTHTFSAPSLEERPGKEKIDYQAKNIYVFSNNKQTSQELLVRLHKHKPEKHKVHGENITGGKGKNIFVIKESSYNVIIGGYDFFLQCVAQKVVIDKIYTLCINGPLQHLISSDLVYYGSTILP